MTSSCEVETGLEWESRVKGKALFNALKIRDILIFFFLAIEFSKNLFPR
jgi:hypothetical protein